jgi:hypothetical protein
MENKKKQKEKKAENTDFKKPQGFKQPAYSEFEKPSEDFKKPRSDFKEPTSHFKKPSVDFKKPLKFVKPSDTHEHVESVDTAEEKSSGAEQEDKSLEEVVKKDDKIVGKEDETTVNDNEDVTEEPPNSRKRKASDGDLQEEDAKKHKLDQPPARAPIKPFKPQPRAVRRPNSRRGKSLKLGGTTRALSKQSAAEDPEASTSPSTGEQEAKSNDDFRNMLLGNK